MCATPTCGACSTPRPTSLAHLSAHPSIVTVYQAGISADGRPYIVMEYCPGSLAERYRIERFPVEDVLAHRRPDGERARVRAPRRARAPRHQAQQHPHHELRRARPRRLRHLSSLAAGTAGEVLAMSVPWSAPEVIAEETGGHDRERGVGSGRDGLLAAGRAQPLRAYGEGPEHARTAAPSHPARDVSADARVRRARSLQTVLATAMSREPGRAPERLEFGEALREVQAEIGFAADAAGGRRRRVGAGARGPSISPTSPLRGRARSPSRTPRPQDRARARLPHDARARRGHRHLRAGPETAAPGVPGIVGGGGRHRAAVARRRYAPSWPPGGC